jgi:hypothetical protein
MTTRAKPVFTVKESSSGTTWIAIEYATSEKGMPVGQFGFDLKPGTTIERARDIAAFLREHLVGFSHTE